MAAYQTREFKKKVTMTYQQAKMIRNAQQDMYDSGIVKPNQNNLASLLSASASILGLAFATNTAAGVAAGVVSLTLGLGTNEKDTLDRMVKDGIYEFNSIIRAFEDNSSYKMIEVELPYIEYKQSGEVLAQFFTGAGRVIRINTGSGWIEL
ncbi:hypothetical protein [Paenibacillus aceti]|uniref:hypothetical protein n=1 Tax=Paenibacillus aceti TaxID=1820010 RepID=UPI000E9FF96D|nr:hypothetical protein [Paenibacillus aceti]HBF2207825.1 hypothetical protein [Clostridioides difficile]